VGAPEAFCIDDSRLLQLRLFRIEGPYSSTTPAVRVPAGPSPCRWDFEGLPAGHYDGMIHLQRDDEIVAMGRADVGRGATSLMTLEALDVEVEGTVTVKGMRMDRLAVGGQPMAADLHLVFGPSEALYSNEWSVPIGVDSTYRAKLGFYSTSEVNVCIRLERARPLNRVPLRCIPLSHGLQRVDVDIDRVPPGAIRVDVPGINTAFDQMARMTISPIRTGSPPFDTHFKPLRGLRGDYLADFGEYEIVIRDSASVVLASERVSVSPERPVHDVELKIRPLR
jgi:hypothetical protein